MRRTAQVLLLASGLLASLFTSGPVFAEEAKTAAPDAVVAPNPSPEPPAATPEPSQTLSAPGAAAAPAGKPDAQPSQPAAVEPEKPAAAHVPCASPNGAVPCGGGHDRPVDPVKPVDPKRMGDSKCFTFNGERFCDGGEDGTKGEKRTAAKCFVFQGEKICDGPVPVKQPRAVPKGKIEREICLIAEKCAR